MIPQLLEIAKKCDRHNKWSDDDWKRHITDCLTKGQYIIRIRNKEIIGCAFWEFIGKKQDEQGRYIQDPNGEIAYVLCAYSKEKNLIRKLLAEGIRKGKELNPNARSVLYFNDKYDEGKQERFYKIDSLERLIDKKEVVNV